MVDNQQSTTTTKMASEKTDTAARSIAQEYGMNGLNDTTSDFLSAPDSWIGHCNTRTNVPVDAFIRPEEDTWFVIETGDIPERISQNQWENHRQDGGKRYSFYHHRIKPSDVWVDGNPSNGFTEKFSKSLHKPGCVAFPESPFDMEIVTDEIARTFIHRTEELRIKYEQSNDYWGCLSKYGVDESTFDIQPTDPRDKQWLKINDI